MILHLVYQTKDMVGGGRGWDMIMICQKSDMNEIIQIKATIENTFVRGT